MTVFIIVETTKDIRILRIKTFHRGHFNLCKKLINRIAKKYLQIAVILT